MKILLHLVLFVVLTALVATADGLIQIAQGAYEAFVDIRAAAIIAALLTLIVGQAEKKTDG